MIGSPLFLSQQSGLAQLLRYRRLAGIVPLDRHITIAGDSRTANANSGSSPSEIAENYGYGTWLGQYTDGKVRTSAARNGGVGGDTTAMWLARMATIIGYGGKTICNLISTNDRGSANLSLETSKRNIEDGLRMQIDAGCIPLIAAELPRGGAYALSGQQLSNHLALRDWILGYVPGLGVGVCDPWVDFIDPESAAAGLPLEGLLHDGLHPGPAGAPLIAKRFAPLLDAIYVAKLPLPLFESPYDASTNVYGWLNTNALLTGTAGTKSGSANATGDVATGYNMAGTNWTGATVACSKEANPHGGEYQVFDLGGTPTTASSVLVMEYTIPMASLAAGNKIRAMCRYSFAGLQGVAGIALDFRFVRNSTAYFIKMADKYLETTPMGSGEFAGVQETPQLTIDALDTEVKMRFTIYGCQNIPIRGRVKVGQMAAQKIP